MQQLLTTKVLSLIILLAFYCAVSAVCESATIAGKVVAVLDGDTVTVLDASNEQHRVRVSGIDAPEKKQAFGKQSWQSMSYMVFNKQVQVEWSKRDRYGRMIGKILAPQMNCHQESCPKDLDAGLAQIGLGLAWHYKKYEREQERADRNSYAQTEADARARKIGLWSEANPVAPWDFRHSK